MLFSIQALTQPWSPNITQSSSRSPFITHGVNISGWRSNSTNYSSHYAPRLQTMCSHHYNSFLARDKTSQWWNFTLYNIKDQKTRIFSKLNKKSIQKTKISIHQALLDTADKQIHRSLTQELPILFQHSTFRLAPTTEGHQGISRRLSISRPLDLHTLRRQLEPVESCVRRQV